MTAIDTLFLDLDDTLYPQDNGVWQAVSERITSYMVERVGLTAAQASAARRRYYQSFGTSLTGLMMDHDVRPDEYLRYVHDIPLERYLKRDPQLVELLRRLPQKKFIFSNASEEHIRRVLALLDVFDDIDGIIGIESLDLVNKPDLRAYARALELAGDPSPPHCLFVDDRINNLQTARQLGMRTVLVDPRPSETLGADYRVRTVLELAEVVPELLASGRDDERPA